MERCIDKLAPKSPFFSMIRFLCRHPPLKLSENGSIVGFYVDEGYSAAIQAAYPNADDSILSLAEFTRHQVMIHGFELVIFARQLVQDFDENGDCIQVGYTSYPVPVVQLPDGKLFEIHGDDDLTKLRAMQKSSCQPGEEPSQLAEKPSQPPADGGQRRPQIVWRNPSDTV